MIPGDLNRIENQLEKYQNLLNDKLNNRDWIPKNNIIFFTEIESHTGTVTDIPRFLGKAFYVKIFTTGTGQIQIQFFNAVSFVKCIYTGHVNSIYAKN